MIVITICNGSNIYYIFIIIISFYTFNVSSVCGKELQAGK